MEMNGNLFSQEIKNAYGITHSDIFVERKHDQDDGEIFTWGEASLVLFRMPETHHVA